jgi:hypothetical protein
MNVKLLHVLPVPLHTVERWLGLLYRPCHWWRRIRLTTRCNYAGKMASRESIRSTSMILLFFQNFQL